MGVKSYRDLIVWQASMELATVVYRLTASFPKSETYGITSQLRRTVVSVASNIAEGHARSSTKEYRRFIAIALGSLAETETQLLLAERLDMLREDQLTAVLERADAIGKMLRRLDQALGRRG